MAEAAKKGDGKKLRLGDDDDDGASDTGSARSPVMRSNSLKVAAILPNLSETPFEIMRNKETAPTPPCM